MIRMKHKCGFVLMIIGTMLVAAALALLVYDSWDSWRAGNSAAEIQEKLDEAGNSSGGSSSGANSLNDGDASAMPEMAAVEIDGYAYIGTLSISRFGLELPVMAEWSYAGMKIAPGRYSGSVWTDDLILCDHNYERHFGSLKDLEEGDALSFTDVDGNVFNYEVLEVIILKPTDVSEMLGEDNEENGAEKDSESENENENDDENEDDNDSGWDLTLFTCTLGGQARVTVRCIRTEE